ncbi:unnamed protein product [Brachionus calyciflorus]|uniref:Uncharacterized protein n=1 Tax=Brachionus calyciflorus TaxID=104777 RepID=A0A814B6C8_9BILA|nr:unnamed protein product [Brachionus calyciflorus]
MEEFKSEQVVPEVFSELPKQILSVDWPHSNVKGELGNVVTPTDMRSQPNVHWEADEKCHYTLLMVDPDAPTRKSPKFKEWMHWMVVNIPGNTVAQGEEKVGYVGAAPPKDTGLHRYVLMVFKQPGRLDFHDVHVITPISGKHRPGFHTKQFVKGHNLGPLVAANFVQAEWDEHSDVVLKVLSSRTEF